MVTERTHQQTLELWYRPVDEGVALGLAAILSAVFPEARLERHAALRQAREDGLVVKVGPREAPSGDTTNAAALTLELIVPRRGQPLVSPGSSPGRDLVHANDVVALETLIGRVAGALRRSEPLDLAPHRARLVELAEQIEAAAGNPTARRRLRKALRTVAGLSALLAITFGLWWLTRPPQPKERFGFEEQTSRWRAGSAAGVLGCTRAQPSDGAAYRGQQALALTLELLPSDPDRSAGEAWVDLREDSHGLPLAPRDLQGVTVVAWVLTDPETVREPAHPNLAQLFVKDQQWRANYGPAIELVQGGWQELRLRVGELDPGQYRHPDFDGHAVTVIGVKIAVGPGATRPHRGVVHLDAVGWAGRADPRAKPPVP